MFQVQELIIVVQLGDNCGALSYHRRLSVAEALCL